MKIYIVNGAPLSGKTTFCNMVIKIVGEDKGRNFSTVDKIKEIARDFGWDGEKTPKARKFLSDLKDVLTDWNDLPVRNIKSRLAHFEEVLSHTNNGEGAVVFIMAREPDEIKRLCEELGAQSLLVRKIDSELIEASNHADKNVLNLTYDLVIDNNGSLEDLAYAALEFVEQEELFFPHWKTIKIDKNGRIYYT